MPLESFAEEDNGPNLNALAPASELNERLDGRYRLRRLLAMSASACVYAGEHVFTRRSVAVKVPRAGITTNRVTGRFRREVEALALVRGDGVVELLDAGQFGGKAYIVFELLEGRTLAGLLTARGRLAAAEVVEIGIQVAEALQRCHEKGVVHRDIKPGNLFLTRGDTGKVTLLDFGIATLPDAGDAPGEHGRDPVVLGTPEYMAPEALLSMPIDHRADIYGLGVTLYECLTGSVPHEGDHGDVLRKISAAPDSALAEALSEVPPALREILHHCLARAPEDRFQSVGELRRALETHAADAVAAAGQLTAHPGAEYRRSQPDTLAEAPAAKLGQRTASRRKHPRAPYTTLARIAQANGTSIDGRLEEVSEGGLQFIGHRSVPIGESVKLRFALPATGRVTEVTATARWNRGARGSNATGFEFTEIADSARAELRQYARIMSPD